MEHIRPLKRFGQNYLADDNILRKIADEINPKKDDLLIEIGPGFGALTKFLIEKVDNLIAIEIDERVIESLLTKFPGLHLITRDILDFDIEKLSKDEKSKVRIAGNIPYNLTSPILFKLIENTNYVNDAVLMIQYEVAQRINAKRGTKDYGILAVLMQYFADVEFCFKVSPNVFYPKPKVFSAVIHLRFKNCDLLPEEKIYFIKVVKAAFGNRRKTLKNSLSNSIFGNLNFEGCGIDLSLRAEQLTIDNFLMLTKFTYEKSRLSNN
ncbi:MAG TPA: 16S rRNA (adenine(1518)-N(6)/adenine(1519)-N(6))-dimethyltransferase RsmA [Ignavibacteriaceae bacterium]|nr:16S rRNA (adenine(1518)-N(6)/adenine(1519)-N(6))-dimethyltransferase RsmA [Ignavibacteriaceae bacterium]